MTNNLLSLLNEQSYMYRDSKTTNHAKEYTRGGGGGENINFFIFEKIVDQNITIFFYRNTFWFQKTMATINETLNRSKNITAFRLIV